MDEQTKTALIASIEGWKKKRDEQDADKIVIDCTACPLCTLHLNGRTADSRKCTGCPVYQFTGRAECAGTPWHTANTARKNFKFAAYCERTMYRDIWVRRAQDMVDFLESLLPPPTREELIDAAVEAEKQFDIDDLEQYANRRRLRQHLASLGTEFSTLDIALAAIENDLQSRIRANVLGPRDTDEYRFALIQQLADALEREQKE